MENNLQLSEETIEFSNNIPDNVSSHQGSQPDLLDDIEEELTATIQGEDTSETNVSNQKENAENVQKENPIEQDVVVQENANVIKATIVTVVDNFTQTEKFLEDTDVDLSAAKPNRFAVNRANLGELGTFEIDRIVAGRRRNGENDYLVGVKYTTYHW
jgi:hypothetical protein